MTAKITIRAREARDVAVLTAIRNQASVRHNTMATPFESVAFLRARAAAAKTVRFLVACVGDEVVGVASLQAAGPARRAHVGYIGVMVAQGWQGRGVGTALFAALVDLADSWLNLSRLELGVFTDNAAGVALYKKFGFEVEAVERAEAFRAGSFADTYLMARLRPGLAVDVSAPPLLPEPAPEGTYALRAAEPEDLPGITALMNEPGVRYGTLRVPFMTEEEVRFLAEPPEGSKSILAVTGAEVLGLVVLVPFKGRRAHAGDLALLAVRDAQRGRGIGGALLGAALEVADDWLNLRRVSLTVQADNAAAVALYAARGFVVEGRRRADMFRGGGYADALVMARVRGV